MLVKELVARLLKEDQEAILIQYEGYWCDDGDYVDYEGDARASKPGKVYL